MHRSKLLSVVFFFLFSLLGNNCLASVVTTGEKPQTSELAELTTAYTHLKAEEDKDLKESIKMFIKKKMEDEQARTANTQLVVSWNNKSSNITFVVSHILLGLGLLAAAFELLNAWRLRSKGSKEESIEVELGIEKLAIKSSINGMLILFISLFFYFMYLKFVYPVNYIA